MPKFELRRMFSGLTNVTHESLLKCNSSGLSQELCGKKDGFITINGNSSASASTVGKGDADSTQLLLGKLIIFKILRVNSGESSEYSLI